MCTRQSRRSRRKPFPDHVYEDELYEYFLTYHSEDLVGILKAPKPSDNLIRYYPLVVDYNHCIGECPVSMDRLAWYSDKILVICDNAAFRALAHLYEEKEREQEESNDTEDDGEKERNPKRPRQELPQLNEEENVYVEENRNPTSSSATASSSAPFRLSASQLSLVPQTEPARPTLTTKNIHVRFYNMPTDPFKQYKLIFPGSEENGTFMTLKGTVVKTKSWVTLNTHREYKCSRCNQTTTLISKPSEFDDLPRVVYNKCKNECRGSKLTFILDQKSDINLQKRYQEIKIQEKNTNGFSAMPNTIWVVLEDDLVEQCKVGDDVLITGTLYLRTRKPLRPGYVIQSEMALKANHIQIKNDMQMYVNLSYEVLSGFRSYWRRNQTNPFRARNHILKSFCPDIHDMYFVKLALVMCIVGGVSKSEMGSVTRGESHLLLVGDPGTGKSQLIKYCSKLMPRSVFTTGAGVSNAGLTAAAVRENGQWTLEAGSLVLANGGLCCIDEFATVKAHDRVSIHEAMEQQTISVAKAGMVTTLPTKCTVIAASNPKNTNYESDDAVDINVGLPTPMLSRFDLIVILKDTPNRAWDEKLCDFVLRGGHMTSSNNGVVNWDIEELRAYLVHVRNLRPVMTGDAIKVIQTYYNAQRQSSFRDKGRTTPRLYEALYRLSEAHAKLMFQDEVVVRDAVVAVYVIDACMQSSAIFGVPPNPLHIEFPTPDSAMEEYVNQAKKILIRLGLSNLARRECEWVADMKRIQLARIKCRATRSKKTERPNPRRSSFNLDSNFNKTEFFTEESETDGKMQCSCRVVNEKSNEQSKERCVDDDNMSTDSTQND